MLILSDDVYKFVLYYLFIVLVLLFKNLVLYVLLFAFNIRDVFWTGNNFFATNTHCQPCLKQSIDAIGLQQEMEGKKFIPLHLSHAEGYERTGGRNTAG